MNTKIDLIGKNAIITGANQGFGLEVAKKLISCGASVYICARNMDKLLASKNLLETLKVSEKQNIFCEMRDVSNKDDLIGIADFAISQFGQVHILVNNAGIYGPMGTVEDNNWDEWIRTIEINLFSVVFLSAIIVKHMKKKGYGKIINLSGGGATNPMPRFSAYAASKAAVVRFTETLAEECKGLGIDVNAIAPGALNTRLLADVINAGSDIVGEAFYEKALKQNESGGTSMENGAGLCAFLASEKSDGITGKLISAVWDPWEKFERFKEQLNKTDIYNLRRIVPKDRGEEWQ